MKTTLIAGGLVLLALWFGYASGYHRGMQNERYAWESTQQRDAEDLPRIFYTNPHHRMRLTSARGLAEVNRPDPRTYRQYEHFLP